MGSRNEKFKVLIPKVANALMHLAIFFTKLKALMNNIYWNKFIDILEK